MAAIWLLAIGHCLSERVSAHWHVDEGKQAEHHHHSSHGPHDHDADGSSEDGSSHGVADHECCELFDSSRPAPQFDGLQAAEFVSFVRPFSSNLISDNLLEARAQNNLDIAPADLHTDRHFLFEALLIANAPPASESI